MRTIFQQVSSPGAAFAQLEIRLDFFNRLLKLLSVLAPPCSRVNSLPGIGRATLDAAQQAAGDAESVGHGVTGRGVKCALIAAAAVITMKFKPKAAIGAT